MTKNFSEVMAADDHSYYPLRFMSSEFFLPYWKYFWSSEIDEKYVRIIQATARECVDYFMQGEDEYWLISFAEEDTIKTWQLFEKLIRDLPEDIQRQVQSLCLQVAVSADESANVDYLLNLMTRLRLDVDFRHSVGYSDADATVLDAVYESTAEDAIDTYELQEKWLNSRDPWDEKLRSQTPDLPESVCIIFSTAYGPRTNLPLIQENLKLLLENESDYQSFISRLEASFDRSRSENVLVQFPMAMRI
jgi:hypothetical protein